MSAYKNIHHSVNKNGIADDNASAILAQLIESQTEAYFQEVFALLPEQCKDVLQLYYYDKQSRKAIAAHLKISLSSVHNRLHRGIWLLKTQFAKKPKNPV